MFQGVQGGGQGVNLNVDKDKAMRDVKLTFLSMPIGFALFVIACCGASGILSGVVTGGCFVGLSIPLILINMGYGCKDALGNSRTLEMIVGVIGSIVGVILGALAIAHIIPATIVGYTYLSITLAGAIFLITKVCCCGGINQALRQAQVLQNQGAQA